MTEPVSDRCGYTWPEDHKVDDEPNRQSCCWREVVDDSEYCIWHADPNAVSKSVKKLQQACASPAVREQNSPVAELLEGIKVADLSLGNEISFRRVSLRGSKFTGDTDLLGADFTEANLSHTRFSHTCLSRVNFSKANLSNVEFWDTDLSDTSFQNANISCAILDYVDLTDAYLQGANLTDTEFKGVDLTDADIQGVDLSDISLYNANLSNADLERADLTNADLRWAKLNEAHLWNATLADAYLSHSDLTDADLWDADLTGANLEHVVCVRTNLFGNDLTNCKPHGATLTDVQINHDTELRSEDQRRDDARWWQRGPLFPPRRCRYDPVIASEDRDPKINQLSKAADTYQSIEKLARENARPSLQSEMFVLRQDMQRKRHWHNRDYFEWGFAQLSRTIFKYGESLGRIVTVAMAVIVAYAAIYSQFDLIRDAGNQFVADPIDALYFSTLTFTTLGLGDFQPEPTSQAARLLVTSQAASGAILIAIFVFVLGRRAAR